MTKRKSYDEVKFIVEGMGFELVSSEYVNSKTPIEIKCKEGHVEQISLNNLQIRKRCPKCSIISRNNAKRVSKDKVHRIIKDSGYTLHKIVEGVNCEPKKLVVQCPNGHDSYEVLYQNFLKGRRCPQCKYDKNRNNLGDIVKKMDNEGYSYLSGEYKSNRSTIYVKCPGGHEYKTTYNLFQANKRCPYCNESKGERITYNFLTQYIKKEEINKQYKIKIDNRTYRVDFMIENSDSKIFIEYDGIQHFISVESFGGEDGLKKQQQSDNIKNKYARDNNIPLLRIPYNYSKEKMYSTILNFLKDTGKLKVEGDS